METKAEKIAELLNIISNKSGRIKKLKLECGQQATKICVLNERNIELEKGGYIRHKHNCLMGEYNSLLTGQGCDCGLSQLMEDK